MMYLGYLMMMHMISCCESTTRVLPYGRFFTRVIKDVNIDLETYFEAPNTYDTYDDQSMAMMKFEKVPDGSWLESRESTNTSPWTRIGTSRSRGRDRDTRDRGWSRPSEWLSEEKARA